MLGVSQKPSVTVQGEKVPEFFVVCLQTNLTETVLTLITLNLSLAKTRTQVSSFSCSQYSGVYMMDEDRGSFI